MNVERSELQSWGRRGFLRAAASSPLLWDGLRQQRTENMTGPGCAGEAISMFDELLKGDLQFVTLTPDGFPLGYFGFALGHTHEVQLVLATQLTRLRKEEQETLVLEKYRYLLGLLKEDKVDVIPHPNEIPAPLFLVGGASADWPVLKGVAWSPIVADLRITGNECADLILELLLETLGLEELTEAIGKVIGKVGGAKILEGIEAIVRARDWNGLAKWVSNLLEQLSSHEAIAVLGEVGGAAARKKFLKAVVSKCVPYVGVVIIVITLVGLVRSNWESIRSKCLRGHDPVAVPRS